MSNSESVGWSMFGGNVVSSKDPSSKPLKAEFMVSDAAKSSLKDDLYIDIVQILTRLVVPRRLDLAVPSSARLRHFQQN